MHSWRVAARHAPFFRALSRTPPPNALMISTSEEKRDEPLKAVFAPFLDLLESDEAEAWARGPASLEAHAGVVQSAVADMLPHGDMLYVTFDV